MQKKIIAALLPALVIPAFAHAEESKEGPSITANVTLATQYIYRGLTQTNGKPAIQGGIDYENSGLYVGTWLSNVSWISDAAVPAGATNASNSIEWDVYGGYKGAFNETTSYDVGFLHYDYPGSYPATSLNPTIVGVAKPNTNEVYGQVGYKWVTLKYSYSLGDTFGVMNARGTTYTDLSANIPLWDTGATLLLHAGQQRFTGIADPAIGTNDSRFSYSDYKVGISKEHLGYVFALNLTAADTKTKADYVNKFGTNVGRDRVTASVTRTF